MSDESLIETLRIAAQEQDNIALAMLLQIAADRIEQLTKEG